MDLWHAFCDGSMRLYYSVHLLPLDCAPPPLGQLLRLCEIFTPHVRSSLQLTVSLPVNMGVARNRQRINLDPWAAETHCGSFMRCRSLILACGVQPQPRSVTQTVQLPAVPLLMPRSITHSWTAHCCSLAVAMCLVAACSALDRHRPHPQPSPSEDDCPVCTGAENVPHPGQFEYYILAKYVSILLPKSQSSSLDKWLSATSAPPLPMQMPKRLVQRPGHIWSPHAGCLQDDVLWRWFGSGSLHGLWPNNCSSCPHDFPYHCSNKAFDINAIAPETLQRMYVDWPSGTGRENTAADCTKIALNTTTQQQPLPWH